MRSSAPGVMAARGAEELLARVRCACALLSGNAPGEGARLETHIRSLAAEPDRVPGTLWEVAVDHALARCAVELAVRRHAGRLRIAAGPLGPRRIQRGKDLRRVRTIIGTGGVVRSARAPGFILEAACAAPGDAGGGERVLVPEAADLAVDQEYLLAPMGLLAEHEPEAAFLLMKRSLRWVETPATAACRPGFNETR